MLHLDSHINRFWHFRDQLTRIPQHDTVDTKHVGSDQGLRQTNV